MKRYISSAEGLNSKQRIRVAKNSTDPKELSRLAYDNSRLVRLEVLYNRNTPQKFKEMICKDFVNDKDKTARLAAAQYTKDPEILKKLANNEYVDVRIAVARRTDDPRILSKLADDEAVQVRINVARRTDDPEILAKLARDENRWVRVNVAVNTYDREILAMLAEDEDDLVRISVSEQSDDPKILAKLANDDNQYVRRRAEESLSKLNKKPRKKSRSAQTDWSIPLYSITNYTEIEDEIDAVIEQAANAYAQKYSGTTAKVECPSGVFDNGGQITINIGDDSYQIDAEDILPPATSKNKKKDCVKTLITWMKNNLN